VKLDLQGNRRETVAEEVKVMPRVSPRALKHMGTKLDPSSKARELVSKPVEAVSKAVEAETAEEAVGSEGAGVVVEAEVMLPVVVLRHVCATTVEKWAILRPNAPTHLSKRVLVVGIILRLPLCSIRPGHGPSHFNHFLHTKPNILTL